MRDGPADAGPPSSCTAMFNFESPAGCGLYGATLGTDTDNSANTDGFKRVYHTADAFCGRGAMAIDVDLNDGHRLGGEIVIPISPTADYTGKTLSSRDEGQRGRRPQRPVPRPSGHRTRYEPQSVNVPITTDWTPLFGRCCRPCRTRAQQASFEYRSRHTAPLRIYKGTVYVDEIDITTRPTRGRSDGPVETMPTDARDAGAGDVRDAPAGS